MYASLQSKAQRFHNEIPEQDLSPYKIEKNDTTSNDLPPVTYPYDEQRLAVLYKNAKSGVPRHNGHVYAI